MTHSKLFVINLLCVFATWRLGDWCWRQAFSLELFHLIESVDDLTGLF